MMINQLAIVAIKASVRVSPATVPSNRVIRSKSRSGLFARISLSVASIVLALSGSRSVCRINLLPAPSGWRCRCRNDRRRSTISNREVGLTILAFSRTLAKAAEMTLRGVPCC